MTKILVFRFSAMGDVVMLLPVLKGLLEENSGLEVYLLTQKQFFPFFAGIDRLNLVEIDLKREHRSFKGLYRLFNQLRKTINPDFVVDLHGVIRSFFLGFYFKLLGYKVVRFDKGTTKKYSAIRKKRISSSLRHTVERYKGVFQDLGFTIKLSLPPLFSRNLSFNDEVLQEPVGAVIGIAPFAKHKQKVWGVGKVDELIGLLSANYNCRIVLFGGGQVEIEQMNLLAAKYSNCIVAANHFTFQEEIQAILRLSVMVSMDSANMHIAALCGIPTVSVWGATHPALGFAPYGQPSENMIQYEGDRLSCRPCSVYGNKKCQYGDDIRCMNYVSADSVFRRIAEIFESQKQ